MKSIMLLVHNDAGQESRLQCALDIVRAVEGRLVGLSVLRPAILADGLGMTYAQNAIILDDPDEEEALRAQLTERFAKEAVPFQWIMSSGTIQQAITDNAGLSDLVVVSREGIASSYEAVDLPALVAMKSGTALMVVPPGQNGVNFFGRAMVAWDGSDTAEKAVRAAAPLLAHAQQVDIVTIDAKGCSADGEEAARYLASHDCGVEIHRIAPSGDTGAQLLAIMHDLGAQWAVAGCYGHSRLREHVFGGVTRTLAVRSPIPLLIAH